MSTVKKVSQEIVNDCISGDFVGCVADMPPDLYHSLISNYSSTQLKYMAGSTPKHFKAKYIDKTIEDKKPTEAMLLGTLVHSLVLTPQDFDKEYAVTPDIDLRTKAGKEMKEMLSRQYAGKKLITEDLHLKAQAIAHSVLSNDGARRVLEGGLPELSYFWKCPYSGLKFRAKVDSVSPSHFVELKTARSANPAAFESHSYNMGYDLSLYHYAEGIRQVGLIDNLTAYFIVCETEAPYVCEVYKASDDLLALGHDRWLDSVNKLERGLMHGEWPGYAPFEFGEYMVLNPPKWTIRKSMEDESGI